MGLGGWQRIGVIVSVTWLVLVVAYAIHEVRLGPFSPGILTTVVESGPAVLQDGHKLTPVELQILWGRLAAAALGPVLAAWAACYGSAWLWRWVIAGFNRHGT